MSHEERDPGHPRDLSDGYSCGKSFPNVPLKPNTAIVKTPPPQLLSLCPHSPPKASASF